jgi:transposase
MRGDDHGPEALFSYVSAEQRVPVDHPLRAIRALVDDILRDMSREFDGVYATVGRPSIPPERLLRAQLLQIFYSIRSERLLMEQLDYNLLFRWFVGMDLDEPVWVPTVFSKNRDRLLNQDVARSFFRRVVERAHGWMSDEHFTVDGTLIEAWASQKSFQAKGGGDTGPGDGRNFHGQARKNATHASKTDPDARLYQKADGAESRLASLGHLLIENRHGLIVDAMATTADGYGERAAATVMMCGQWARAPGRRRTLGADAERNTVARPRGNHVCNQSPGRSIELRRRLVGKDVSGPKITKIIRPFVEACVRAKRYTNLVDVHDRSPRSGSVVEPREVVGRHHVRRLPAARYIDQQH